MTFRAKLRPQIRISAADKENLRFEPTHKNQDPQKPESHKTRREGGIYQSIEQADHKRSYLPVSSKEIESIDVSQPPKQKLSNQSVITYVPFIYHTIRCVLLHVRYFSAH